MPAAGEGVNSEDGIIVCAQCLTSIKEGITIGVSDQRLDVSALDDPVTPIVSSRDICEYGLIVQK
jgi:hypothetical protein